MRPKAKRGWTVVSSQRRLRYLTAIAIVGGGVSLLLVAVFMIVRPKPPIRPHSLVGDDVDGLALFELNQSSQRVGRLVEVLARRHSYDVQTHPDELERELSQLLSVLTYRRAIGVLRRDPASDREQWAVVVGLKRMGSPLKVLVKELLVREQPRIMETATSSGVLLFWREDPGPCFAIYQRAFVAASDRAWLGEVIARLENPLEKTPRANRLLLGLPPQSKHSLVRANVLVTPARWQRWIGSEADGTTRTTRLDESIARLLRQSGLHSDDPERLTLCASLAPRGQLRFDLSVACRGTPHSRAVLGEVGERWGKLVSNLRIPWVDKVNKPTTDTGQLSFAWMTPPVEQMLGLGPTVRKTPPRRGAAATPQP